MKILKSVADSIPDFELKVSDHSVAMKEWRGHMARVKADEANGVTGIDKHWPRARPAAHPAIESAVNDKHEIDFEIVDDGPTPEQVLAYRKNQLMGDVSRAEAAAIAALLPPGKVRLSILREAKIRTRDGQIVSETNLKNVDIIRENAEIPGVSALRALADKIGFTKPKEPKPEKPLVDIAATVNAARSDDEQTHLAFMKKWRARLGEIELAAAQAHADVEDLTLETIDAFKVPTF